MGLTTKKLSELLSYKDSERLQLPEIQRDFVWRRQSVKLLFDSLYRGLPIGQMLVWKPKTEIGGKSFHKQKRRKSAGKLDGFYGYLLDGQQRLTAISQVRDLDDEYPLMFDLWTELEANDQGDRFYWDRYLDDSNPWNVSVADVISKDFDISAHLRALEENDDFEEEKHAEPVRKLLTRLQSILEYEISVIEYESDDYEDATELFVRFNSTGRKLNKSDLVLAELATRVEGLTSKEMARLLAKFQPHFQFSRSFLLQCLAAVHTNRMNFSNPEKVFGDSEQSDIWASWQKTARGLEDVIDFLTTTVRWDSGVWVPSFNALIPLVYLKANNHGWTKADRGIARKWLLLAGVRTYFSGSVYSELDQIVRKLHSKTEVGHLWDITRRYLRKLTPDDFDINSRSGPVMALFMSMLRNQDAKDWIKDLPINGTIVGQNAQLQVHHFFPRALLSRHDYISGAINAFGNLTIIRADTNLNIGMQEPATYLIQGEFEKTELEKQCIPMDRKLWHLKNFDKFLVERNRLLAERCNSFLQI